VIHPKGPATVNASIIPIPPFARILAAAPGPDRLTPAELRIVCLIAVGWKPREIPYVHRNSVLTIRAHLYSAYHKLGFRERGDLILWAVKHGLGGVQ